MTASLRPSCSLFLIVPLIAIGCSSEKFADTLKNAKAKTQALTKNSSTTDGIGSNATGSITLGTSPPCQIDQAYISVIVIGDGRPNVVQVASYDVNQEMTQFPSVLIHGLTSAENVSALTGQTVLCDLYFQQSVDNPIAMTKPGESANVIFGSITNSGHGIAATIESIELLSADDQIIPITGGQFLAVDRLGAMP